MARKSGETALITLAIIAAPFVWLYQKLGPVGFWSLLIGSVLLIFWGVRRFRRQRATALSSPPKSRVVYEQPLWKVEDDSMTLKASIVVSQSKIDERISNLHKTATAAKEIDWPKAIASLREASELMRKSDGLYPNERWTRYPVFLQQASRFDEAMEEFSKLIGETEDRIARESEGTNCSALNRKMLVHAAYEHIYDKMRMACQRQKLPDQAAKYAALKDQHRAKYDELVPLVEEEHRKIVEAYRKKQEARRRRRK
jgi:hypothetical protein